jgi:hypothetical protein
MHGVARFTYGDYGQCLHDLLSLMEGFAGAVEKGGAGFWRGDGKFG